MTAKRLLFPALAIGMAILVAEWEKILERPVPHGRIPAAAMVPGPGSLLERRKELKPAPPAVAPTQGAHDQYEESRHARRWSRWEHQQLTEWIERDDPCAILGSGLVEDAPLEAINPYLLSAAPGQKAPGAIPDEALAALAEAFSKESSEEALGAFQKSRHEAVRFYLALYLAGSLEGIRAAPATNLPSAEKILRGLTETNGNNGAFFLYLARIRKEQGAKDPEVRELATAAIRAPSFNNYGNDILLSIFAKGLESPAMWALAQSWLMQLPAPHYGHMREPLFYLLPISDTAFAKETLKFGLALKKKHFNEGHRTESVYWNAMEHEIARSIAREAWHRLYPDKAFPSEHDTRYRQFPGLNSIRKKIPASQDPDFFQTEKCRQHFPRLFGLLQQELRDYLREKSREER